MLSFVDFIHGHDAVSTYLITVIEAVTFSDKNLSFYSAVQIINKGVVLVLIVLKFGESIKNKLM